MNLFNSFLIIFGGLSQTNTTYNDVYIYDIDKNEWFMPDIEGDIPDSRCSHSSVIYENKLYIYGGSSPSSGLFDDLWELDISDIHKLKWKCLSNNSGSGYREMHSSCIFFDNDKPYIFIHGGRSGEGRILSEGLIYSINDNIWLKPIETGISRCSHTINCIDNKIIIFGGINDLMKVCNEFIIFNINSIKIIFS